MTTPLVHLQGISLTVAGKSILSRVELQVAKGHIVTLIGPNGAGKTTLLRVLLRLETPTEGVIWHKPGLKIGYMPQRLVLNPLLPLSVDHFLRVVGTRTPPQTRLTTVLKQVGMPTFALNTPMSKLSGGELQRILLARALLREPELLVLDEPVQGVDIIGQNELYSLITHIRQTEDCGILLVSHDLHVVMASADEVVCLNTHVCCSGQPSKVQQDPAYLALYTHQHQHHHDLHGEIHEHS